MHISLEVPILRLFIYILRHIIELETLIDNFFSKIFLVKYLCYETLVRFNMSTAELNSAEFRKKYYEL
jgi:hypothetical protein